MASGLSKNELNHAKKKYYGRLFNDGDNISFIQKLINLTIAKVYLLKYSILNFKREVYRFIKLFFFKNKIWQKNFAFNINLNDEEIEKFSEELKTKNFIFIENFLSDNSYQYLLNSWPDIDHFNHRKKVIKHYNFGFQYKYDNTSIEKTFKKYPKEFGLRQFYEFLLEDKSTIFYNKLFKAENENFFVDSLLSTMASSNSYLIPHYDTIAEDSRIKNSYNFIYFVDGDENNIHTDGSGATGIYQDNEFKLPLLVPKSIKNSILIYNSKSSNFYHGFKNINRSNNIYRKTINLHSISL